MVGAGFPSNFEGEVVQIVPLAGIRSSLLRKMVLLITDVLNLECNSRREGNRLLYLDMPTSDCITVTTRTNVKR